jgi:hypothetical protein
LEKWRGKCYVSTVGRKNFMRLNLKFIGGRRREAGYVGGLWEVLIAFVIVAAVFGTIVGGYVSGAVKMQWSAYSLAAQTMASHVAEQTRSASWDPNASPPKNEVLGIMLMNKATNNLANGGWILTGYSTNVLDVPWSSTNCIFATNYVTISQLFVNGTNNPYIQLQMVRVDTVWPFSGWGNFSKGTYTNTACTLLAPDNRDPISLGVSASP